MSLTQYVYFALSSERTTADEITRLLGIEPDETTVRASRSTSPVAIPSCHHWKIVCRGRELRVNEQMSRVVGRLQPHTEAIAQLASRIATEEGPGSAVLHVVRYFNDTDQEEELLSPADRTNLFGWHLGRDVLEFLTATGAELDVDEYDMAAEND
ncbi:DUF4279 domain-containing protein [Streptomyces canus]|uniref:DUF4279 domain-containing protein n=1 Tax=Streptomyces canus TaxID=58343 RepID=UPI002E26E25F|nr:DUF4279 domain-containing protein [Streptomyces canus]